MARSQIIILPGYLLLLHVLCEDWKATMPESIQALNGSCVIIPCSFTLGNFNSKDFKPLLNENCNGVWKKNNKDGPIVFSSSISSEHHSKGTRTGNIAQRDCTSILHNFQMDDSDQYFFRIECDNALKWSFPQSVKITAQGNPFKPVLSPATVRVDEGTTVSVNLTCSAVAPCPTLPPTLSWTPRLNDSKEEQEYADRTKIMTSVFTFTASHVHHGQRIYCAANYQRQDNQIVSSESWLTLSVKFAPKVTSISVSPCGPLREGSSVTLTCSSDANPAVSYTWYRVDGGGVIPVGFGQKLITKVESTWSSSGRQVCYDDLQQ
ncbi:myelin-associated glycoprotein-like [Aplochiton taeniatus]